jgi:GT2 family glycosyltransferase
MKKVESRFWIIIPVHNRERITRACLERLRVQGTFDRAIVCVVDDGCTDGTRAMLESEFPEVHRVEGNGHLYWGGGILEGMIVACEADAEVMVWLNDDCLPAPGSIEVVIERALLTRGICGGVCFDPDHPGVQTYGGTHMDSETMVGPPRGQVAPVTFINGNLVAVHRHVVERIGLPPGRSLPHYGGDSIYSLRAVRAGIPCEVHGDASATNPPNRYFAPFGRSKPFWHLLKEPSRRGSILYWPTYWRFLREAFGMQAYIRWPMYFVRLGGQLFAAFRRQVLSES